LNFKEHIFLTGFMGSGKSTQGKHLAALLKQEFTDLDSYIEEKEKTSIQEIFNHTGENEFRKIEQVCLQEILSHKTPRIISLGGGTICFYNNLELIKASGLLIYLELSAAAISSRITTSSQQRPLLKNLQGDDLLKNIEERLNHRKKYYEQSDISINGLNLTTQQLHQAILEYYQKKNT
jgi:shikimate kinase